MMSIKDIAAIKVAVQMCNNNELKREILATPGSGFVIKRMRDRYNLKQQWDEIVEKKAIVIINNLCLPIHIHEKVTGIVLLTGMRMLTWAKYHEGALGFSREYSINFLNGSFFTSRGIIDNKKAAEELMNDKYLSIKQKYKLACLYCLSDRIPVLYKQISKEDKEEFSDAQIRGWVNRPGLIQFWTNCMIRKLDKQEDKNIDLCRLERAVEIGSKAAVQYCLESTSLRRIDHAIVDTAMKIVRKRSSITEEDWIIFQHNEVGSWVPNDNYIDILCFLLSKMREDQRIEFLKADIEDKKYCNDHRHSRVLEYFLNWPYKYYFVKMAGLMWEFLPEVNYAVLLLMICDKIEASKKENLKYGEEKCNDYRALLKEFWNQSPERYKRYVFSNQKSDYRTHNQVSFKTGAALLSKLLSLKNFTNEDMENIRLILGSAEDEEKGNIISSEEWKSVCIRFLSNEKFEALDRFVVIYFLSKEEEDKFKCELIFTKEAQSICIRFLTFGKWNAADSLIRWSSLPKENIYKLKKKIIYSENGRNLCLNLISCDNRITVMDKFVRWCFPSEVEANVFKKKLIFSLIGVKKCADLVENELELANEFISFSLSSEEEIRELKKTVAYKNGCRFFNESCDNFGGVYDIKGYTYSNFNRFVDLTKYQSEKGEKFLSWCFSSEEEIREYKKNNLLKASFADIHFQLIEINKWKEAEAFFAWLKLSAEEIKELKKETLFHCDKAIQMFKELMDTEDNKRFAFYGGKQKAIKLFSRWFLTDIETVLEFKDKFKSQYQNITEKDEAALKNFDLMIEQRLKDLNKEKMGGVKRKSATLSPDKTFSN